MCSRGDRRAVLAGGMAALVAASLPAESASDRQGYFLAEAERMRRQAVASGDQSYGAVLVLDDRIVGYGPSRVIADRNPNAHAERVAIWAAQQAIGRNDLSGAVLYSTSRPCTDCEAVAAQANVARMIHGIGMDAGTPRIR